MVKTKEMQVSTQINMLWEGILMTSVFGTIDSGRVQEIMNSILKKVMDTGYKTVILDILGVAVVDSAVANHIIKITKATKLMGCKCIISGISPEVAQSLVNLGIDLEGIHTSGTLQDALELAFEMSGLEVRRVKK